MVPSWVLREIGPGCFGPRCGGEADSADCRSAPTPPYADTRLRDLVRGVNAQLSPKFRSGWDVFLHRGLAGAETGLAGAMVVFSFAYQTEPSNADATHLIHDHPSLSLHCALDLEFVKLKI